MNIIKRFEAVALDLKHYFTGKPCKYGHIDTRSVLGRKCHACDRENKKQFRLQNPEILKKRKQVSYYKHIEKSLARRKRYVENNRGAVNTLSTARKKHIKRATPKWVDKDHMWLIKEAYELAQLRTKQFGFSWHVDHIVPIQGELVSGLHVIENLQVIPAIENIKKKNKFEVDYAN